jgi:hypothetical protein
MLIIDAPVNAANMLFPPGFSENLLNAFKAVSQRRQEPSPVVLTLDGLKPSSDVTVRSRGGWRFLAITGPVWTKEHFPYLLQVMKAYVVCVST